MIVYIGPMPPRAKRAPTAKAKASPGPTKARTPRAPRKKAVAAGSRGLAATEALALGRPAAIDALAEQLDADGGQLLGAYRDPLGGHWQLFASLPLEKVAPTPFQRDLSEAHAKRLGDVIDKMDRFLDPIVAVRTPEGMYWTPNGAHRLEAMRRLGARAIVALLVPEPEIAFRILALNTEKAHNLREKALEVIRMARSLATLDPARSEQSYGLEFEEPQFLTLGCCYEQNGRFSGGAYQPILKRVDGFLPDALPAALTERESRSAKLLEIDQAVAKAVAALKERGFESPYLKAFVVARINPIRFLKGEPPSLMATLDKMLASAARFDPDAVKADQVAAAAGPPEES
jgi:ParB family chromosome partitioning protein